MTDRDDRPPRYESLELVVPGPTERRRPPVAPVGRPEAIALGALSFAVIFVLIVGVLLGYYAAGYYANTPAATPSGSGRSAVAAPTGEAPTSARAADSEGGAWLPLTTSTSGSRPSAAFVSPSRDLRGLATWYDVAAGHAAAGPALRAWLGPSWRGETVRVCRGGCVLVELTDWCACAPRGGTPTLIDLSRADFAVLATPSAGVARVTIETAGAIALPATDTIR